MTPAIVTATVCLASLAGLAMVLRHLRVESQAERAARADELLASAPSKELAEAVESMKQRLSKLELKGLGR